MPKTGRGQEARLLSTLGGLRVVFPAWASQRNVLALFRTIS